MKIEHLLFPSVFFKIKDPFNGRSLLTLFWTRGGGKFAPPAGFFNIAQKPLGLGN